MRPLLPALVLCSIQAADVYTLRRVDGRWRIAAPGGEALSEITPGQLAEVRLDSGRFEDVFDEGVQARLGTSIRGRCEAGKDRPGLVGYQWTNGPAGGAGWVQAMRRLDADHAGRQQYVQFLKEKYAYNIGEVNRLYGLDATSFTDLTSFDFTLLDMKRPAVREDDAEFLGWIAQVLYKHAAEELRKCDSGRLIFSEAAAWHRLPRALLQEAAKTADVLMVGAETGLDAKALASVHESSGKPIVLDDPNCSVPREMNLPPFVAGLRRCANGR